MTTSTVENVKGHVNIFAVVKFDCVTTLERCEIGDRQKASQSIVVHYKTDLMIN